MPTVRILADSSVWINYLRQGQDGFLKLIKFPGIGCHPFVVGEVAAGSLSNRTKVIPILQSVFQFEIASDSKVLSLMEKHRVYGRGVGYIDFHLLTAIVLSEKAMLWTNDKRLNSVARQLGVEYKPKFEQEIF